MIVLPVLAALFFFSCQKEFSPDTGGGGTPPDLATRVSSSVSGFVTDENDLPVKNAGVQFGSANISTDKYGYFEFKNVQVVKNAAVVTVNKPGYFKGIKTYIVREGKPAFFRIKLIPKTNTGSINGGSGGNVTLTNGLSITLPAGAVVNASTSSAYTGTVNVAAFWINPEASDLDRIMPGDLRGIDNGGLMQLLKTFGMAAVELTGASGELLQIAPGKKATLALTIPASLMGDAPASLPLWYFDEDKGLWKEEGSATKSGNKYQGDVSHFSYWNCDMPLPNGGVPFDCTIVDANGSPLPNLHIWIDYSNGTMTGCHGTTNANGYASGLVPANAQLIMKVYGAAYGCSNVVLYSQAFTTTSSPISLGTITVPGGSNQASVTGTLTDCNGQPVTNGYVMMNYGGIFVRYNSSNTGSFSFSTIICGNINNAILIGGDAVTGQEGTPLTVTLQPGSNNVGNLVACGTSVSEYFNYTINGTPYSVIPPNGSVTQSPDSNGTSTAIRIYANSNATSSFISFDKLNIAAGSNQNLVSFNSTQTGQTTIPSPVSVNISEYGSIGQFISGSFTGSVTGTAAPNTTYTVTCNFRVRRVF